MTQSTILSTGTINGADSLTIELVQPDGHPAVVRITWPLQPTVVRPDTFPACAAKTMRVVARASVELAGIKAERRL